MSAYDSLDSIKLAEHDELLAQLRSVMRNEAVEEFFFPSILEHAGQMRTGSGIAIMLTHAYDLFKSRYADMPAVPMALYLLRDEFAKALIGDNDVVFQQYRETSKLMV